MQSISLNLRLLAAASSTLCSVSAAQSVIEPLSGRERGGFKPEAIQLQGVEFVGPDLFFCEQTGDPCCRSPGQTGARVERESRAG